MTIPKVVVFVQTRMGSTRLPGKNLKMVLGKEILLHMYDRLCKAKTVNQIVIITSLNKENDIIEDLCKKNKIEVYRGSENDLLDRHYKAAQLYNADFVVKIPSDCPLVDPQIVDEVICLWLHNQGRFDYVSNYHPPTFPDGLDVEGSTFKALEIAWKEATSPIEREHTFPYIWDNPNKFKVGNISNRYGNMFLTHRWTLDYEEDFVFGKSILEAFKDKAMFYMKDILNLLDEKPYLMDLNRRHLGINWYRNHEGQLKTITRNQFMKKEKLRLDKSLELLEEAKKVIPCATQTLSKGYLQWSVGTCPLFVESGKGCVLYDVDGNSYIDYGMALGPFILGYSDDDVNKAVLEQLEKGTMFTLPHSLEVAAAKLIIENVPCAEMVRFGKNGSDATTAAIKLARSYTGKEKIIVCGYHGWHDWYIASTERNAGIPRLMEELVIRLKFNDIEALLKILNANKGEIAGLIMEPMGAIFPNENYLEKVREITQKEGVILIFDELFTGFRWGMGGAQEYFKVIPDLACFGKAIANGFPISCIAGKREIMEKFEDVFYSSTYGGETLSLKAVIATIEKLKKFKVHDYIFNEGSFLIDGVKKIITKYQVDEFISIIGSPFKSVFQFSGSNSFTPLEVKTFFQQECAIRGVLFIGYHLVSYSHKREDIEFTLQVYDEVINEFRVNIQSENLRKSIKGQIVTQIFKNVGDRSQ